MESDRIFGLSDHLSSCMSWRCLETARSRSFWARISSINANCLATPTATGIQLFVFSLCPYNIRLHDWPILGRRKPNSWVVLWLLTQSWVSSQIIRCRLSTRSHCGKHVRNCIRIVDGLHTRQGKARHQIRSDDCKQGTGPIECRKAEKVSAPGAFVEVSAEESGFGSGRTCSN